MALFFALNKSSPLVGRILGRLLINTKEHIRKRIGRARFSFAELKTLEAEVAFVINSRPLTHVSNGSEGDPYQLTFFALIAGYKSADQG